MKPLADKLWIAVQPAVLPGQPRGPERFHYRLRPGASNALHQAEALLVALEAKSLRDAFTAMLAAERWSALVDHGTIDHELHGLLFAATCAAGERIAMALPERPRGDETVSFRVISGDRT